MFRQQTLQDPVTFEPVEAQPSGSSMHHTCNRLGCIPLVRLLLAGGRLALRFDHTGGGLVARAVDLDGHTIPAGTLKGFVFLRELEAQGSAEE